MYSGYDNLAQQAAEKDGGRKQKMAARASDFQHTKEVNSINYSLPKDNSIVTDSSFHRHSFRVNEVTLVGDSTSSVQTCTLSTAGRFIDGPSSYLTFTVQSIKGGHYGPTVLGSTDNSSAVNFIHSIRLLSVTGAELERVDYVNAVMHEINPMRFSEEYLKLVGGLCGYNSISSYLNHPLVNETAADINPINLIGLKFADEEQVTGGPSTKTTTYVIPLHFLLGLFSQNQLLPPQIIEGATIEIVWEAPTKAVLYSANKDTAIGNEWNGAGLGPAPDEIASYFEPKNSFNNELSDATSQYNPALDFTPTIQLSNIAIVTKEIMFSVDIVEKLWKKVLAKGLSIPFTTWFASRIEQPMPSDDSITPSTHTFEDKHSFTRVTKVMLKVSKFQYGSHISFKDQWKYMRQDYFRPEPRPFLKWQFQYGTKLYPDQPVLIPHRADVSDSGLEREIMFQNFCANNEQHESATNSQYHGSLGRLENRYGLLVADLSRKVQMTDAGIKRTSNTMMGQRVDMSRPVKFHVTMYNGHMTRNFLATQAKTRAGQRNWRVFHMIIEHIQCIEVTPDGVIVLE
jgi:hypothetical protein